MKEADFQRALLQALCALPTLRVWRQNCGGVAIRDRAGQVQGRFDAGAPKGAADLTGIAAPSGLRIEVEVKVDHAHTPEQRTWQAFVERFGAVYVLVRWDRTLDIDANVARGVRLVLDAIEARRAA